MRMAFVAIVFLAAVMSACLGEESLQAVDRDRKAVEQGYAQASNALQRLSAE
ncbi:MAG: hypothetical protein HYZ50_10700 [Deltaproteobacteria bacterium]|nr:hypothetical protein [Deltaproteobacteria bacterium]